MADEDLDEAFDYLLTRVDEMREPVPDGLSEEARRARILRIVEAQKEISHILRDLAADPRAQARLRVLVDQLDLSIPRRPAPVRNLRVTFVPDPDPAPTPPGRALERILRAFTSQAAFDLYVEPALADAQYEYVTALQQGKPWLARWRFFVGVVWLVKPWAWAAVVAKVAAWWAART